MKKEEWINHILDSTTDIQPVEANPFLYYKVANRLKKQKEAATNSSGTSFGWTMAFSIILALNVSGVVLYQKMQKRQVERMAIRELSMQMNPNTIYYY